jgi:hypothetical protein
MHKGCTIVTDSWGNLSSGIYVDLMMMDENRHGDR